MVKIAKTQIFNTFSVRKGLIFLVFSQGYLFMVIVKYEGHKVKVNAAVRYLLKIKPLKVGGLFSI